VFTENPSQSWYIISLKKWLTVLTASSWLPSNPPRFHIAAHIALYTIALKHVIGMVLLFGFYFALLI